MDLQACSKSYNHLNAMGEILYWCKMTQWLEHCQLPIYICRESGEWKDISGGGMKKAFSSGWYYRGNSGRWNGIKSMRIMERRNMIIQKVTSTFPNL